MVSQTLSGIEQKMKATIDGLNRDLTTIRTGRASPALVDSIRADYAGVPTPIKGMASITAPQARLLVIQPWDRSTLSAIEKAIQKSDLGLNPSNDGQVIRLVIPPLTEERREELMKLVHRRSEERKVTIRKYREDALKDLRGMEKNKEISQDELKRSLDQLQKLTDKYISEIERTAQNKEKELHEV